MPRPATPRRRHAGLATTELVLVVGALGVIAAAGVIVAPLSVGAAPADAPRAVALDDPQREAVRLGILELVRESHALLLTRDAPATELALWTSDDRSPGLVDPDEILVLRFSPTVGAVAAYLREPPTEEDADQAPGVPPALVTGALLDVWRDRPRTTRSVIAAGLEEFRVVTTAAPGNRRAVRVHLVWAPRRADEDAVEGVFEVRLPPADAAPRPPAEAGGGVP